MSKINNHSNEIITHNPKSQWATGSKDLSGLSGTIKCQNVECLSVPMARCIRCSRLYCYEHIQLCFQIHTREIEIIRPIKNLTDVKEF